MKDIKWYRAWDIVYPVGIYYVLMNVATFVVCLIVPLTDESYGVYLSEKLKNDRITVPWMHGNNVVGYLAWGSSTILGTALGSLLPNPSAFGLDFALVAMFIGIFAGQFQGMRLTEKLKTMFFVLGAVALSFFLLTFFLSQSLAVLVATLTGCLVGVICDARE